MSVGPTLSAEERESLQQLVTELGEVKAIAMINVSREALARALAGLTIRRGTVALVRAVLANHMRSSPAA